VSLPESPTPPGPSAANLVEQFRARTRKLTIHPTEQLLLWVTSVHLVFLPWALGAQRPWGQWTSLALGLIGFAISLIPRDYTEEHTGANSFRLIMWPRLLKFPLFWLGLAMMGYVIIQATNPAWVYTTDGKVWWMTKVPFNEWLPSGVRAPFATWGPWRMLLIYAATWLTVCSIWVGFTRRRSVQTVLVVLAANGLLLAALGTAQKLISPNGKIFWLVDVPGATTFASFIYKNHGGNYLNLTLAVACGLAAWFYLRGLRRLEKSNPSGVFAFMATCIAIAILISFARGATVAMLVFVCGCVAVFSLHQLLSKDTNRKPVVAIMLLLVFGYFAKLGLEALNSKEAWSRLREGLENTEVSLEDRRLAKDATLDMAKDYWKRGAGVGSFRYIFPLYQQKHPTIFGTGGGRLFWEHAHNDVVEIIAEQGIAGLLILIGACGYLGFGLLRARFWRNPLSGCIVFGVLLTIFQAWWDFPFHCVAVFSLWWIVLLLATMWARFEDQNTGQ
jgi:O-antigen ligase